MQKFCLRQKIVTAFKCLGKLKLRQQVKKLIGKFNSCSNKLGLFLLHELIKRLN